MRTTIVPSITAGLIAVLLLAACGQASDLHTAADQGPPPPIGPPLAAPQTPLRMPRAAPAAETPLPPPIATATAPLALTAGCPSLTRPGGFYSGLNLPLALPTGEPMPIQPPAKGDLTQPASFTVMRACTGRVLEMHIGDTVDLVLDGSGDWSAVSAPPGLLRSEALARTAGGSRWRYRALQTGAGSLSIYLKPQCAGPPCPARFMYLALGAIVR